MKKLFFLTLLLPVFAFSQKAIDSTVLSNGKTILLYSDYTWKYKPESKNAFLYTPPAQVTESTPKTKSRKATIYQNSNTSSNTGSHQCHGITKKGSRCLRMVANGYNCYQHGG